MVVRGKESNRYEYIYLWRRSMCLRWLSPIASKDVDILRRV